MIDHKPFIITIVGPESSGKTTLARQLASHFECPWVPEYAREYLEGLGRPYEANDLNSIAVGQLEAISTALYEQRAEGRGHSAILHGTSLREAILPPGLLGGVMFEPRPQYSYLIFQREEFGDKPRPLVVVDSGMLTLRMWAQIKYKAKIPAVENALKVDETSLYLLCRPVVPWEADPLREAPSLLDRVWIYNHYLKEISAHLVT